MFFQKHPFSFLFALPALLMVACASPKAPTGGEKDEAPPAIISEESTPNLQTNFKEDKITITFDEWFAIKDAASQVVISPLMPEQPDIKQKGKSIIITLPDSLKEETTYTINFGNAIADLNEGNVLENYAFVFSTGAVLDSNKMNGKVINALTLAPADGVWVMLYPVGEDSAVYKRKPEYVAKTNKEGQWALSNIRTDSFQIVALKDDNLNFLYDQETELIGWIDYNIYILQPNSILPQIQVFPKEKRTTIREVIHNVPGWMKMVVDAPQPKPMPVLNPPLDSAVTTWDGDTLHVWYNPANNYAGSAMLASDTTRIRVASGASIASAPIKVVALSGRLHPQGEARFSTGVPFISLDTSLITLANDSTGKIPFVIKADSINKRVFTMSAAWKPVARHTLTFLPGAVRDVWGRVNDTIKLSIVALPPDQFGDLTLNVDGLDSTRNYVLLIKSGEQIFRRFDITQLSATQLRNPGMLPGKYTIEIIEDLNGNGVWDTGDYHARRQPERKMIFTPDNLRAAWELEAKMTWQRGG